MRKRKEKRETGERGEAAIGQVAVLSPEGYARAVESEDVTVVAVLSGTCAPCHAMRPVVEEAARRTACAGVRWGRIPEEEVAAFGAYHGLRGYPTLLVLKGGVCIREVSGKVSADELVEIIREATGAGCLE